MIAYRVNVIRMPLISLKLNPWLSRWPWDLSWHAAHVQQVVNCWQANAPLPYSMYSQTSCHEQRVQLRLAGGYTTILTLIDSRYGSPDVLPELHWPNVAKPEMSDKALLSTLFMWTQWSAPGTYCPSSHDVMLARAYKMQGQKNIVILIVCTQSLAPSGSNISTAKQNIVRLISSK